MSVLIKDMEKPKSCCAVIDGEFEYCQFVDNDGNCMLLLKNGIRNETWEDQYSECPIVEVPKPHGDLIDRQKLLEDNKHLEYPTDGKYRRDRAWAVGFNSGARHCNEHAVYGKTVIEAEGER